MNQVVFAEEHDAVNDLDSIMSSVTVTHWKANINANAYVAFTVPTSVE